MRDLGIILLLAGCYFSTAQLGLHLVPTRGIVAAIWPPSGVALAAVLVLGVRVWPGITMGALASALVHGHSPAVALSLTAAGTAAAVMGAWMLRSFGFDLGIQRVRDVWYLMAIALATGIICPTFGCAMLALTGQLANTHFLASWLEWAAADVMGMLLVTPLLLTWTRPPAHPWTRPRQVSFVLFLLAVLLVSRLTVPGSTGGSDEPHFLLLSTIFPLLIWGALQFGTRETILAAVILSSVAAFAWTHTPSAGGGDRLLVPDLFITEIIGTALLLGSITVQQRRAYDELERRVRERTTELARSNEEKEILLKEIHHRVKNNMQVICSLLNLEARGFGDARLANAFADSQFRVKSMALVHEHLYQSQSLGRIAMRTYLSALVHGVASSQPNGQRVECDVQAGDITMPIDMAVPCGLIVNEVVTNVFKHAFPGDRSGHLRIALSPGAQGEIVLLMSDDGVGMPAGSVSLAGGSFGMRLISMLAEQLQGKLELLPTAGTTLRLAIPQAAGG